MHGLGSYVWPFGSSFQRLIFALVDELHSNRYGVSIPLQSCLQCCLLLVNSSEIFSPRKQIARTCEASVSL